MKKLYLITALVALIVIGSYALRQFQTATHQYPGYKKITYTLNNKQYKLLVADTPQKWELGLMNYRKLYGVQGMIFLFPDFDYRTFWNKNTLMDLDLYWIKGKLVAGKSFLPSIEKSKSIVMVNSNDKVNVVIELEH